MGIFYEDLWAKSKIFIERAINKRNENEIGEFQLWASFTLEILGKATLSYIHPSLIVDPNDVNGLLKSCGYIQGGDCKTITAKTVFTRCKDAIKVPRFHKDTMDFCVELANRRNADLHSGAIPFEGMRLDAWLPKFWDTCRILLEFQGKTLQDWIGREEASTALAIINNQSITLQITIESRINKHRRDIETKYGGRVPREIRDASSYLLDEDQYTLECPSCGKEGLAQGELISEIQMEPDPEEPWVVFVEKTFEITSFWCPVCDLKLNNYEEIIAANMKTEFTMEIESEPDYEPDYGNE